MNYALFFISALVTLSAYAVQPVERKLNYQPEGRAFVCINGQNRFTRALYGSHTAYRIETSDRPVFAVTDGKWGKNIQFRIIVDGQTINLDSTEYCKASYEAGRRDYWLKDPRFKGGTLQVSVLACPDKEGGVWQFVAQDFQQAVQIEGCIRQMRAKKLVRSGDLGRMEQPGCFEAAEGSKVEGQRSKAVISLNNNTGYIAIEGDQLQGGDFTILYNNAEQARNQLASMVTFNTPDAYLNTIGGAMVMAADGAWDGRVWNHGAVGWRMPLPGWRGAYAGDFLGMPDRQRIHFNAYAKSQVTDVPVTKPHLMDSTNNLARGTYEWGTPMYSNGYICRNPENNHQFHHYDMNLVYIDELLWHFQFDADTAYMRQMWPVIKSHLAWEKNCWDPDGDHLYDAYCCIWASDALQYNSGAVTHSSAYNYRGNLLAARIAEIIGEDATPYQEEADAILQAMNQRLWLKDEGHWAEFQDYMGRQLLHKDAALWSIYTPIDCGSCTPEQAYNATLYIDRNIPHIPFSMNGECYETVSTSDWQPYEWSINNVAMAEVLHTALAYYQAGRPNAAYRLLKGTILDFMYLGSSPANFGQISWHDAVLGESYRDFADVTGIATRTFIEGLYGITPDALNGRCIIRPGFPEEWDSASVHTPYMDYSFKREGGEDIYTIHQRFRQPLTIVMRQNTGGGLYIDTMGSSDSVQTIILPTRKYIKLHEVGVSEKTLSKAQGNDFDDVQPKRCTPINISRFFNANVSDIFAQKYLSPRSPYTTLCLPTQGIGDWCSTKRTAHIDDSGLRAQSQKGRVGLLDIPFLTPQKGQNIIYTSLWDNYPDSITIPLRGSGSHIYLMMAGSTNAMQSHFTNAEVRVRYADGTTETLELRNPDNWCPIEQNYRDDGMAFALPSPRSYRFALSTGAVSRNLEKSQISDGAGQLLDMPINPNKKLKDITLVTIANDVVIGLMAVTVQK